MIDRAQMIADAEALEAIAGRLRSMAATPSDQPAAPGVEQNPPPPAPAGLPSSSATAGLQKPSAFFDFLKNSDAVFPADSFNEGQVASMNAILDACAGHAPIGWTAYILATAYHETGATFEPDKVENLNYSVEGLITNFGRHRISIADAQRLGRYAGHPAEQEAIANTIYGGEYGRKNLGNVQPGDGWLFRGRSWPQFTGRRNYQKVDDALGLGGALMANPDRIGELAICAPATRDAMIGGWFTGVDLNEVVGARGTFEQFKAGRAVVNGTDKDDEIAAFAVAMRDALIAGVWL